MNGALSHHDWHMFLCLIFIGIPSTGLLASIVHNIKFEFPDHCSAPPTRMLPHPPSPRPKCRTPLQPGQGQSHNQQARDAFHRCTASCDARQRRSEVREGLAVAGIGKRVTDKGARGFKRDESGPNARKHVSVLTATTDDVTIRSGGTRLTTLSEEMTHRSLREGRLHQCTATAQPQNNRTFWRVAGDQPGPTERLLATSQDQQSGPWRPARSHRVVAGDQPGPTEWSFATSHDKQTGTNSRVVGDHGAARSPSWLFPFS